VEVEAVAAQFALLAEVAEFGIADGASGMAVDHGVGADAIGVGGFDDHIAGEIGDLAAKITLGVV